MSVATDRAPFGIRYLEAGEADITITLKGQASGKSLGLTTISYSGGLIRKVRIEMAVNSALGLPLDAADIHNVAAHEFGHTLGLSHSSNPGDLMYHSYDFVRVRQKIPLSSCDLDRLLAVYKVDGFAAPNAPSALSTFTCS